MEDGSGVGQLAALATWADLVTGCSFCLMAGMLVLQLHRAGTQRPYRAVLLALGGSLGACAVAHWAQALQQWLQLGWLIPGAKVMAGVSTLVTVLLLPSLVPHIPRTMEDARVSRRRRDLLLEANEKLKTLFERLKAADQLRSQLFTNVSHELRTPLTLLTASLQTVMEDERFTETDRRELRTALRNARLLQRHVDELIAVAKREAGEMRLHYMEVDVTALVRQTCTLFESLASQRNVEFLVETPNTLRAQLDPDKLERVLLNVLFNAFKFTPVNGRIRCALEPVDNQLRIQVGDSGPGIPESHRVSVFERYRHQNGAPARQFGGLGLGLSICKDLVGMHGGAIQVTTAPEGGALFTITLPTVAPAGTTVASGELVKPSLSAQAVADIARAELQLEEEVARAPAVPGGVNRTPGKPLLKPPLVLVVEDNPEMRRLIQRCLQPEFEVALAEHVDQALYRARALMPDLVISDVMLPEKGGLEFVTAVRTDEELHATPILVLTAVGSDELRVRLLQSGAQDFMTKPFLVEELRARVRNLTGASRARSMLAAAVASQKTDLQALAAEVAQRQRELRTALQATEVARDLAERASRVKGNFLRVMSHELRTPITAMRLQARLLETRAPDTPTGRQALDGIHRCSQRLLDLVDTVLEYARIEGGRFESRGEPFSLGHVLEDVTTELRPHADHKKIQLTLEAPEALPPLWSDERLVRLIAVNLVGNAVKFTQQGGVVVRAAWVDGLHVISVTDSGPGIAPQHLGEIFEPFQQLDDIRQREGMGSGLGLAIVRDMVQAVGGQISVASEVGVGSTFSVALPKCVSAPGQRPAPVSGLREPAAVASAAAFRGR